MKGDLVSITSRREQEKIRDFLDKFEHFDFWIGGNDLKREGHFKWSDGSPFSFTFWYTREPNNRGSRGQEDCVILKRSYYNRAWNDLACSFKHPFICRVPN